jgi:uroporphyrinogen decarboxylase
MVWIKKEKMTAADRVMLAMGNAEPDRVPVGFFPLTIGARMAGVTVDKFAHSGELLAKGQRVFYEKFQPDWLVPYSDVPSVAEAWGTKTKFVDVSTPYTVDFAVKKPEDWENPDIVHKISASEWWDAGRLPYVFEAQDILVDHFESEVPILSFIVSPITLASWIGGLARVSADMIRHSDLLHNALDILADSMIELCKTYYDNGLAVCYMAFTRSTRDIYTFDQYAEFGVPYDLKVLNGCKSFMTFMGHVCGREPYLDILTPIYPLVGINFWDRGAIYDLAYAKKKYGKRIPIIGGVDQTRELLYGTPDDVRDQVIDAIKTGAPGGGYVCAPGCELSFETSDENIAAMVNAIREYGTYPISEKVMKFEYKRKVTP